MALELESLQQMGVTLKENSYGMLSERWPSTDDEFADAVTTVCAWLIWLWIKARYLYLLPDS